MTPVAIDDGEPRILLVEDNPGDARLLRELLEEGTDSAWAVDWVKTSGAARERLTDGASLSAVLLDLDLPDSSGLETVRAVRGAAGPVPVVVLTGHTDPELGEDAVREGAEDYLIKEGLEPRTLVRTLRYALLRTQADREIRRRERHFRALVSNLSDVISVVEADGTVLYESPSLERVLGYRPEELEGENIWDYFHPDDRDRIRDEFRRLTERPDSERGTRARFRHADGSWRVLEARGRTPPAGTDIDGAIIVSRDVTEQVERERELEEATGALRERVKEQSCLYDVSQYLHTDDRPLRERLADVVDRLPEGWQHPETTAARLELDGREWTTDGFSEDAACLTAPVEVEGEQVGEVTVCCIEPWPVADVGPFLEEEQVLLEAIADQVGVTAERRKARRELDAERERLAEVFRNAPAWVATLRGPEHVFEMANPAYYDLVGDRDVVGKTVREVFPELEGEGYFELLDHVYETGETVEVDERPLRLETDRGSEEKYISFVYQPRREDGEVVGVIAHGVDVTEQVERRREAEERRETLEKVLDTSADGILLTDAEGNFTFANPAAEEMLGLERAEIASRTYRDPKWGICGPDGGPFPDEQLPVARVLETGSPVRQVKHGVKRPDGERRVLSVNAAPLKDGSGEVQGVVASLRDVTRARKRRKALKESEARHRTLVETMAEATVILDRSGAITFANAEAEDLLGLTTSEVTGRTYDDPDWRITAPDGSPFPEEELPFRRVMETGEPVRDVEHAIERPDGSRRILAVNAAPLLSGEEGPDGVVATIRDVTERKQMEGELRRRALYDGLTGLPNRSLFQDRLQQALARGGRRGEPVGLLILDLDRFKQVNDHLGHTAGDRLLEELAHRLEDEVRGEDTAARLGGDEFAVVLPEVEDRNGLTTVVDRLIASLDNPFRVGGDEVEIDVTLGGVLVGEGEHAVRDREPEDVLRYADLALYRAKETAGPSFHLFHPEEDRQRAEQLGREQELRRAIRREEFDVVFQPIVRLEEGDVWGVEPLARWHHPEQGTLGPGEFIPLAEETGLIHDLGRRLLQTTCRHLASWPEALRESVFVTPNLSGRQFDRDSLVSELDEVVREAGLDPGRFWVEVTESAVTRATGRVQELREAGFRILVDDFGTGYSSFHYLRDLELDGLKIDMSFVHAMTESSQNRGLVETMITMGRTMDLVTVAEGIETEEQRRTLREMGCPLGQGYLFTRPMPAEQLGAWMEARS